MPYDFVPLSMKSVNLANHHHVCLVFSDGLFNMLSFLNLVRSFKFLISILSPLASDWCWTLTCWSMRLDRFLWWCAHGSACSCLCWWFPTPCSTCGHRPSLGVIVTPGCAVCCLPLYSCSTKVWVWDSCLRMWWWPTVFHLLPASSSSWNR